MIIMDVGLKVDFLWYPIGDGDFVHSFFSTISCNFEKGNWGSPFPCFDLAPELQTK